MYESGYDNAGYENAGYDNEEDELSDIHHELLDKSLSFKGKQKGETGDEEDESAIGGWKNKLSAQLTPLFSMGGSLFIVLAAFFLLAIVLRKVSPQANRPLPKEAFECLGRYSLTQKHHVQILRMGSRIVLVSVMPDGVSTLAEITDPDEAVSFLGLCRRLDNNSATEMFRKTIANMSEDELSRPHERPVVTARRKGQSGGSLDLHSDPDESLAAILARGRHGR
jgi:flagellar biogenesis protein FliO